MSSLAFDKQGRPFKLDPRTRLLRVCEFNNPGARGTCANVYDDDGELLHVEVDCTYLEFAKQVGEGFFRLVQCDENRAELDAPPAYVNVRPRTRNQFGASDGDALDPRDAVILHLTQSNQELARTNAEIAKAALAQHAAVMMASANLMREYTAAPPPPRISVIEAPRREGADDGRDDQTRDDDDQADDSAPEATPVPGWMPIYQDVKPYLPQLGMFLYTQVKEVLRGKTSSPAAAPTPAAGSNADADASPAPNTGSAPNGTAAGPSAPSASTANTSEPPPSSASSTTATAAMPNAAPATENAHGTTPSAAAESAAAAPDGSPRNAPAVSPTPEQMMRLLEIRSKLTPTEIAIAEHAIKRMSSDVLAQWLADLTARSVDDAVRTVRSMIAQAREQQGRG